MLDGLGGFLCGCWLAPLGVVGLLLILWHQVHTSIRMRGLQPGQLYCRNCRYVLRGVTRAQCPECGMHLSGATLTSRETAAPPFPFWSRMVLALIISFGPLVALFALLGLLVPGNVQRTGYFQVVGDTRHWSFTMDGHAVGDGIFGSRFDRAELRISSHGGAAILAEFAEDRLIIDRFDGTRLKSGINAAALESAAEVVVFPGEDEHKRALSERLADLLVHLRDEGMPLTSSDPAFQIVTLGTETSRDFRGWYIVLSVIAGGVLWFLLIRAVHRSWQRESEVFGSSRRLLEDRLEAQIRDYKGRVLEAGDLPRDIRRADDS